MQHLFIKLVFVFAISGLFNLPPNNTKLKLKIYNIKILKGNILVYIYNKEGTIPDKDFSKYYKMKTVPVTGNTVEVNFDDLPKGKYAVMIHHDENKNGKLDKTFMRPKEGFGLSNFKSVNLFNKPDFEKASFMLKKDTLIKINTIYF